jgi:hypothetical protein
MIVAERTHHHRQARDSYHIDMNVWTRGRNAIAFVAMVSWIAALAGYFSNPDRFFQSYLNGFLYFIGVPLGAIFFVMVQYLTGSAWSVPMRRIAENIMVSVPAAFLLFIPIALGLDHLYSWTQPEIMKLPVVAVKSGYLNPQWFTIRAAIYIALWSLWTWRIYSQSVKQDKTGSLEHMHTNSRWSAPGLLMLFLSATLAAWDWSMSLNPTWYSTIFGIYFLAGSGYVFIAVWTLICLWFRKKHILAHTINVEHYHDLGKWLFCMTVFWAYIAFSQYLLIWYANLPEETIYFRQRFEGTWAWWSWALLIGHFIIPFLALIMRATKRNVRALMAMALWIMAAHFVDIYWQVMPTWYHSKGVQLHWLDVACWLAVGSVYALVFWFRVRGSALLPIGDPRFEQGLHFENM